VWQSLHSGNSISFENLCSFVLVLNEVTHHLPKKRAEESVSQNYRPFGYMLHKPVPTWTCVQKDVHIILKACKPLLFEKLASKHSEPVL